MGRPVASCQYIENGENKRSMKELDIIKN